MLEVTADGKQEIVEGNESLKKKPKKKSTTLDDIKKSIAARWEIIAKSLDNSSAFMPMMEDDEEEESVEGADEEEASPESADTATPGAEEADPAEDEGEAEGNLGGDEDHSELEQELKNAGYSDAEIAHIVHGHVIPAPDVDEAKYNNEAMTGQIEAQTMMDEAAQQKQMREQEAKLNQDHQARMNELAYKDAEEKKGKNKLDMEHHKRMLDLDYENNKNQAPDPQFEKEHRKRMADVEYENARSSIKDTSLDKEKAKQLVQLEIEAKKAEIEAKKKQIELDLKFKEREHELKLKQMELDLKEQAKRKSQISGEKHKHALAAAKKPPKPMKKSDDEFFDDDEDFYDEDYEDMEKAVPNAAMYHNMRSRDLSAHIKKLRLAGNHEEADKAHAILNSRTQNVSTAREEAKATMPKFALKADTNAGYLPNLDDIEDDDKKSREAAAEMEKIEGLPIGWSYNPKTRNLNHSMHGSITITPHSKDSKLYSVRHNGGEYGKFTNPNEAAQAAINRAREFK